MTYFNLRKHVAEPEPDEVEAAPDGPVEEDDEQPAARGPLIAGLLGPGRWLAARVGMGAAWTVHVVAVWAVGFYGGWTAAAIISLWLLAVLAFMPREYLDGLASRIEAPPNDDHQEGEGHPFEPLAVVLWHLIGDAPGAHLKTLTARLQEAAPEHPLEQAEVRAKLGALGIPLRGSVRDAAGRVNEGVHRADLKAWEEALSPAGPTPTPGTRSGPVATAVTCDVANTATPVATPLSRFRRVLSRGGA